MKNYLAGAAAAVALTASVPAVATTFSFANGASTMQTISGLTVTASAWSTDSLAASDIPEAATIGRFAQGLGVINQGEGDGTVNNSHTIDNVVRYDFVRLDFSKAVVLNSMTLNPFPVLGTSETDTDAWISQGSGAFNTQALWQNYLSAGRSVPSGMTIPTGLSASTTWLIGAARSATDRNDGFKLNAIGVTAVPEPATWAMMIAGFGLVGGALRRRRQNALAAA